MQRLIEKLKSQHHQDTTRQNYYTVWKLFNKFYLRLDVKPNTWEDRILLFTAHLIDTKKQSSTVKSYISAVKAVLQEDGYEIDENKFLLASLTQACKLKMTQLELICQSLKEC